MDARYRRIVAALGDGPPRMAKPDETIVRGNCPTDMVGTNRKQVHCARLIIAMAFALSACGAPAQSTNGFDLQGALVPVREIKHGGPPRDGIPALDQPDLMSAEDAAYLALDDRVLGVSVAGEARAYPIRILNYHEIVNDEIAGEAVVVTYCPLCGSGMAFRSTVGGSRFDFGVSGLLYNSDVLLYDRQTESLWSQIMQKSVTGSMKGTALDAVVLSHTTWRDWRERHPQTRVLSNRTGYRRNYEVNPYPNYNRSSRLYFTVANEDRRYARKALVLGIEIDGAFKAYPFEELDKGPHQFSDSFGARRFEVVYDKENDTARIIDDAGVEVPTLIAFWFAWYAFHPDTAVYEAGAGQ